MYVMGSFEKLIQTRVYGTEPKDLYPPFFLFNSWFGLYQKDIRRKLGFFSFSHSFFFCLSRLFPIERWKDPILLCRDY